MKPPTFRLNELVLYGGEAWMVDDVRQWGSSEDYLYKLHRHDRPDTKASSLERNLTRIPKPSWDEESI